MGALLLLFGGLLVFFGGAVFRVVVSRAFGVRSLRAALGVDHAAFSGVSFVGRSAVAFSGLVGAYLAVALLFAMAIMLGGETRVDGTSMRVSVAPNGPADRAGIANGDRIVAVNDRAIADWDALKSEIAKHAGEDVAVQVDRAGATHVIHVTPGERGSYAFGKILVGPYSEKVPVGIGGALASGLVMPTTVWWHVLRGFSRVFRGQDAAELSGPVAIVRAANDASRDSTATGIMLAAVIYSYFFFIAIMVTAALFPRRRTA